MLVKQEFMTSREVCNYCNFSMGLLNSLDKKGILRPRRRLPVTNKRLYVKEDIDAFLKSIATDGD